MHSIEWTRYLCDSWLAFHARRPLFSLLSCSFISTRRLVISVTLL